MVENSSYETSGEREEKAIVGLMAQRNGLYKESVLQTGSQSYRCIVRRRLPP